MNKSSKEVTHFQKSESLRFSSIRLKSFKSWYLPVNSKCSPKALAECGFYHRPDISEDSVQCFVCQKVLGGWEADEDPMEEHKSHCPQCLFVKYGAFEFVTRGQAIEMECQRFRAFYEQFFDEILKETRYEYERQIGIFQDLINNTPLPSEEDLSTTTFLSTSTASTTRLKRTKSKHI